MKESTIKMLIAEGQHELEEEDEDVISSGDIGMAFLFGDEYTDEDASRLTKYTPFPGAETECYELRGPVYGSTDAPLR